jgi:hypothetical protein
MNDQDMLAAARAKAGPCPACGTTAGNPILWGYPSNEDFDRLGDSVGWVGCIIPETPAATCAARAARSTASRGSATTTTTSATTTTPSRNHALADRPETVGPSLYGRSR